MVFKVIVDVFPDRGDLMSKSKTIYKQIVGLIYDKGRGWAFSRKDFTHFSDAGNIDRTLSRMAEKGVVRRVMRGLYDYPVYSSLLKKSLNPDANQVAHALARKFGWHIQISGNAALNLVGLSTQVPTQYLYLSDGPSKAYQLGNTVIQFKKTRFTQLGLKYPHNEILIQAVQALGDNALTNEEQQKLRDYLFKANRLKTDVDGDNLALPKVVVDRTLKDTQYVTGWIAGNIRKVLLGVNESLDNERLGVLEELANQAQELGMGY